MAAVRLVQFIAYYIIDFLVMITIYTLYGLMSAFKIMWL